MHSKVLLIFYIPRENRYTFNALFGASEDLLERFSFVVCRSSEELISALTEDNSKEVFLFLSFFTIQVFEMEQLLKEARTKHPSLRIVAGGPHPSGAPEDTLKMGVDIVVRGEGEYILRDILNTLASEGPTNMLESGRIFQGRPVVDLDGFPPLSLRYNMVGPIEITRGCPFRCLYCQTPRLFPGKPRHRSPEVVFGIVQKLVERGLTDIRFISPNAFSYGSSDGIRLNIEALEILLKGIRGILCRDGRIFFGTFPSEVRPEHVRPETLELIKRYCDNDNIVIGAQSGSERVLKALRRGHAVEDVKRAVRLCKDYGIKVNVDFIFGLPEETEKDQMDTVKLMQEVVEYGARVHAHYFMPLPGTPLQDAMASPLSDKLLQAIKGLLPTGRLFGQWAKQREFTEKLLKRRSQYVSETAD